MSDLVLLGDEAVALGAVHAGLTAAYAYPGTPSTEILEYLIRYQQQPRRPARDVVRQREDRLRGGARRVLRRAAGADRHEARRAERRGRPVRELGARRRSTAAWWSSWPTTRGCTARRTSRTRRYYADFARVICLEPATQQEAYDMTREAFDLSERFHVPVMMRLVTRLAHSRAVVRVGDARAGERRRQGAGAEVVDAAARQRPRAVARAASTASRRSTPGPSSRALQPAGAAATDGGRPRRDHDRDRAQLLSSRTWRSSAARSSHLHIGAYPIPVGLVRRLARHVAAGPGARGGLPVRRAAAARPAAARRRDPRQDDGRGASRRRADARPRAARARPARAAGLVGPGLRRCPPGRRSCARAARTPTRSTALNAGARRDRDAGRDLRHRLLHARRAAALLRRRLVRLHGRVGRHGQGRVRRRAAARRSRSSATARSSTPGVTPLMDAVAANTDMTLFILDNETTAMTGGQPTILPPSRIEKLVLGLGVDPAHCHVITAHHRAGRRQPRADRAGSRPTRACRSSSPCGSASRR